MLIRVSVHVGITGTSTRAPHSMCLAVPICACRIMLAVRLLSQALNSPRLGCRLCLVPHQSASSVKKKKMSQLARQVPHGAAVTWRIQPAQSHSRMAPPPDFPRFPVHGMFGSATATRGTQNMKQTSAATGMHLRMRRRHRAVLAVDRA